MLGKLSVPGRSTNLDESRPRAYCDCSRCGLGLFGHFSRVFRSLFSFSLSGRQPNKYYLKGPSIENPHENQNEFTHLSR